jgi:4-hydroxy-2-oxoheptanedioate aldolase
VIDMEHTPISLERVAELVRAAEAAGIDAIVRVPSVDAASISRSLETGAVGVQVPLVRSAADAEIAVRATRFAPRGTRGLASPRQTGYGARMSVGDWVDLSERRTVVVVQIEDRNGLEQAEAIAAVDGVDVVFVGLTDLSRDLGVTGRYDAPELLEAVERIRSAAAAAGKAFGVPAADAEAAARQRLAGARFVAGDDVRILLGGAVGLAGAIRRER